jgi:hypothetical protein
LARCLQLFSTLQPCSPAALQTRHSDRLDFHDLAVWSIEAALKAALEVGQKEG